MSPDDLVHLHMRLTKPQAQALKKLKVATVRDLLHHFPARYTEAVAPKHIAALAHGDTALVSGKITALEKTKAWRKKIPLTRATVEDASPAVSRRHAPRGSVRAPQRKGLKRREGAISRKSGIGNGDGKHAPCCGKLARG